MKPLNLPAIIFVLVWLAVGTMTPAVPAATDTHGSHEAHETQDAHDAHDAHETHDAHSSHDHEKMVMAATKEDPELTGQVKIEERLGEMIEMDAVFKDSKGKEIRIGDLFDKPVVLLPIYFMCTSVCNFLQADLADALNQVGPVPGKDFNVISLSFADDEDHTHAHTSKYNYLNLVTRDFPTENWYYLTGTKENIRKVTDSLGYYFIKKKAHFYIHPSAMMVMAKDGKIARYLYGPDFLPFDIGMALSEAQKGETGVSIKRGVLSFCFDYDPENKTYVFKTFRITGTAILILLVGFVAFLVYPSNRDREKKDKTVS